MNDFNGKGYPLEDDRLTLSGTTPAGEQQYRIWRDSQTILIPKGQSTTLVGQNENVQANTGVFSSISQGYFRYPVVEFRNTIDYKLFDRFYLRTFRDGNELPTDVNIFYNKDLWLSALKIKYEVAFSAGEFAGYDSGVLWLDFAGSETSPIEQWYSDVLHFDNFALSGLKGDYTININPVNQQLARGEQFNTGENANNANAPISICVQRAEIFNGNSKMELQHKNPDFTLSLDSFEITILGGE